MHSFTNYILSEFYDQGSISHWEAPLPRNLTRLWHASLGRMESGAQRWSCREVKWDTTGQRSKKKDKGRQQSTIIMKVWRETLNHTEWDGRLWAVQHQCASAHHSFIISFAEAVVQSMSFLWVSPKRRAHLRVSELKSEWWKWLKCRDANKLKGFSATQLLLNKNGSLVSACAAACLEMTTCLFERERKK